ncbi:MAG: enolase C-terminal domain-like protein [Candidatus Dormibacteria bacterium]
MATAYTVPTEAPESDGTLTWDRTTVVVVEPHWEHGASGLGYAYGTPAMVGLIEGVLAPQVVGHPLDDPRGAWRRMVDAVRNLGRPGLCSMAIAAVEIALWDGLGRWRELPLHRLLGGSRDEVPIYGSGGFCSLSDRQLQRQLGQWVEAGIPRVKMKIGGGWGADPKEDLRRIGLARKAVGPTTELYVDANGAYDGTTARELGRAAHERHGVAWFEEPVSSDDLRGLARLRSELALDVTAGEYGYTLAYFGQMLEADAVDVLQADVSRCAGIGEWLRVADAAAARMVPLSGHCAPTLHAAAATVPANLRHLEYFHDHVRVDRLLFDGLPQQVGGELRLGPEPGLGVRLRREAARFRVS